jgi:hypothetical protein
VIHERRYCEPTSPRKARADDQALEANPEPRMRLWIASELKLLAMTLNCGGQRNAGDSPARQNPIEFSAAAGDASSVCCLKAPAPKP